MFLNVSDTDRTFDKLVNIFCRNVTIPKGKAKEREFYTVEEVEKLLKLLENEDMKYRVFFNLAVYSGFRRSEMLGLEWKDIDFETGLVHIQRTSNYVAGMGMFEDTTKTKSSQRYIKLPPVMLDLLKEFKAEQYIEKTRLGTKWVETDRLFVKWNGEPMSSTTTYTWLSYIMPINKDSWASRKSTLFNFLDYYAHKKGYNFHRSMSETV